MYTPNKRSRTLYSDGGNLIYKQFRRSKPTKKRKASSSFVVVVALVHTHAQIAMIFPSGYCQCHVKSSKKNNNDRPAYSTKEEKKGNKRERKSAKRKLKVKKTLSSRRRVTRRRQRPPITGSRRARVVGALETWAVPNTKSTQKMSELHRFFPSLSLSFSFSRSPTSRCLILDWAMGCPTC